jgi:hypothetical protein
MRQNGKLLILVLLVCMLASGSACANASETNYSGPDNDNADFSSDEFTTDPHFIAVRGTFPETIDQEWKNTISDCWLNLTLNVGPSYSEFDTVISNIGVGYDHRLVIELGSAYRGEINDSRIDGMYRKIEEYCREEKGISEIPVVFMWAEDEEDLPLPNYGPEILDKAGNSSSVIAVYGAMPVITEESEKRDWTELLGHSKGREVSPYFAEFGGPVLSYGVSINGYLSVGMNVNTPEKVNESVTDEIYQAIDGRFTQEAGIDEVPVVFFWAEPAVTDEAIDENPTTENNSSAQITPGFTAIMLILCLWLLARR